MTDRDPDRDPYRERIEDLDGYIEGTIEIQIVEIGRRKVLTR